MARYGQLTDSTAVSDLIPAAIVPEVVISAVENETFMPLVRRFDFTGPGSTFAIPQVDAMAWTTITLNATADDEVAYTTSKQTCTPGLHNLDVVIPFTEFDDSVVDLQSAVAKEAGIGLADYRDGLAAALKTDRPTSTPDHFLGTDATEINFTTLRDAQNLLYIQKAPKPFNWVVHPTQFTELLKDDTFINAGVKGSPVLTKGIGGDGFATKVLDVNVYVAEQIVEDSGLHSMMFSHQAALAYGYKMIGKPGATKQEVMMDIEWNSTLRFIEINMTIRAQFIGAKGTAAENTWMVVAIS